MIVLIFFVQEHTGSALFILYKAIKVQVEKGPLDYMTGCAKYTLSEAKLFTAGDDAKPLVSFLTQMLNCSLRRNTAIFCRFFSQKYKHV